jgi:hypothetical protein
MHFNASNISYGGVCPSPGTAITERPQARGIASVTSTLDVAVPETGTLLSRNPPATFRNIVRGFSATSPRNSATFIKLQNLTPTGLLLLLNTDD